MLQLPKHIRDVGIVSTVFIILITAFSTQSVLYPQYAYTQTPESSLELTILSEDSDGDAIEGYYVVLLRNGEEIDTDFTPAEFTVEENEEYVVQIQDFEDLIFDHWEDTSSSSRERTISITSDTELTAVYSNTEEQEEDDEQDVDPAAVSEEEEREVDDEEEEEEEQPQTELDDRLEEILEESRNAEPVLPSGFGTTEERITETENASSSSDDCFEYHASNATLNIICDADLINVTSASGIGDNVSSILTPHSPSEYVLNTNISVSDNATLSITGSDDFGYLRMADDKGITVFGKIEVENVTITSWDNDTRLVIDNKDNPNLPRGYLALIGSEGGHIINSTIAYLGYNKTGYRGVDLMDSSHDFVIRNSTFDNMWYAFYSNGAYNITIDSSEFKNNLRYAIDPHTGTHNMNITDNHVYNNSDVAIICSLDCYDILFEGNTIHSNNGTGILFSRNTTNSIARYNTIYNQTNGISLSESSNNEIYGNNITNITRGIYLINPIAPDDGVTTSNHVYNNTIGDVQHGMVARRSEANNLSDNNFAGNVSNAHYFLTGNSTMQILNQTFSDTEIRGKDGQNIVTIANSGPIIINDNASRVDTDVSMFRSMLTNQTITINSANKAPPP